jgi:CrcB protein
MSPWAWLGLAGAGACGALGRYHLARFVNELISRRTPSIAFPTGTFAVNLTGAFLLGLLTGLNVSDLVSFVVGTGLLGSYTTFSTWMTETVGLLQTPRRRRTATTYLLGSAVLGLGCAAAGLVTGTALGRP